MDKDGHLTASGPIPAEMAGMRPRRRLSRIVFGLSFVLVALVACAVVLSWKASEMWKGVNQLKLIEQRQLAFEESVRAMTMGSLTLTDAVRRFVTTGKLSALDDYFREAKVTRRRNSSFDKLAGFSRRFTVRWTLQSAMNNSMHLMEVEYRAMRLAARLWDVPVPSLPHEVRSVTLTAAEEALAGDSLRAYVHDLVFGEAYREVQMKIVDASGRVLDRAIHSQGYQLRTLLEIQRGRYTAIFVTMGCVVVLLLMLVGLIILAARQRGRMLQAVLLEKAERDRMEAADKAKSLFFSSVSHDIRTPLNAIIGFSELLEAGDVPPEEAKRDLSLISMSGKTLLQLVNDLLDLSKLEAGKMEIAREPTDLHKLVAEVLPVFGPQVRTRHQSLVSELPALPILLVDPYRLRQILFNLVGNAVKYAGSCTIRVIGSYADGQLTLGVADSGAGLEPEVAARLMRPYVQASALDRSHGTGLGLSVCRMLATCMGGRFTLDTAPGKGCMFTIVIPAEEAPKTAVGGTTALPSVPATAQPLNFSTAQLPSRVLVVDDSPVNRSVLRAMLTKLGVTDMVLAEDGKIALAKLQADAAFDVVLTDMWMPEMGGEGLVKALRTNPALARLTVVSVTADVEALKTFKAQGFDDILLKPVTLDKLRDLFGRLSVPH